MFTSTLSSCIPPSCMVGCYTTHILKMWTCVAPTLQIRSPLRKWVDTEIQPSHINSWQFLCFPCRIKSKTDVTSCQLGTDCVVCKGHFERETESKEGANFLISITYLCVHNICVHLQKKASNILTWECTMCRPMSALAAQKFHAHTTCSTRRLHKHTHIHCMHAIYLPSSVCVIVLASTL